MSVDYYDYIQSPEWRERANVAKRRAGNRCQVCNRPATAVTLEAHHRTYERLGKERPEDLTVLCRDCHALYEANKRLPQPPVSAPVEPASPVNNQGLILATTKPEEPLELLPRPPLQFVPVRSSRKPPAGANQTAASNLPIEPNSVYRLLPEASANQTLRPSKASPSAADKAAQAARDSKIRITAILIILAMLMAISLLDNFRPSTPRTAELRAIPSPATPLASARPTITTTVAAVQPVLPSATTLPVTPLPTDAPPTATTQPAEPTATVAEATATIAPPPATNRMGMVTANALVCRTPCSCSPVARTITSATQVPILETQQCGMDTWYRIGDDEWLGSRWLEEVPAN